MKALIIFLFLIFISFSANCQTAESYFEEGRKYSESKNYAMAQISFSMAIQLNPYEWNYYQRRSWVLYETKSYEKALEDINMALKLKPKHENYNGLSIRSRIYLDMRNYKFAIEDLDYMIDYFPNEFATKFGICHLDRGKAFLYSGLKVEACNDFHESLSRRMADAEHFIKEFCN
jgi:tetratricopeptide (TPR) repeat protein